MPFVRRIAVILISFALAWVLLAKEARAQVVFAPSITNNKETTKDNTGAYGSFDSRFTTFDFRLAYLFEPLGLLAGGLYKLETNAYSDGDLKGFALGPSLGWVWRSVSAIGTYFLMAERKRTVSNQESTFSSGHGFQLDLAWTPQLAPNFGLGPQVTYRSVKYTKSQIGSGSETSNSFESSVFVPYLALWFVF